MARARSIKPGYFGNDILAECDPLARILFSGLWCFADREGRLEYRVKKLKASILPFDDCDIDELVQQLIERRFVVVYCIEDAAFLQVVNFCKHQNPHMKEPESTIPAPDSPGAEIVPAVPLPLTLNPLPLTLNPVTPVPGKPRPRPSEGFEVFWGTYPRKIAKGTALKAYTRALAKTTPDVLLAAAKRFASECSGKEPQYVAHPATWLNGERWLDQPAQPTGAVVALRPFG